MEALRPAGEYPVERMVLLVLAAHGAHQYGALYDALLARGAMPTDQLFHALRDVLERLRIAKLVDLDASGGWVVTPDGRRKATRG